MLPKQYSQDVTGTDISLPEVSASLVSNAHLRDPVPGVPQRERTAEELLSNHTCLYSDTLSHTFDRQVTPSYSLDYKVSCIATSQVTKAANNAFVDHSDIIMISLLAYRYLYSLRFGPKAIKPKFDHNIFNQATCRSLPLGLVKGYKSANMPYENDTTWNIAYLIIIHFIYYYYYYY